MISYDAEKLPPSEVYRWLIGAIVPRPIAFVTTVGKNGIPNAAPFSFFCGVSSNPPCLAISIARKSADSPEAGQKDTLKNILETGEFVVHSVNEDLLNSMHQTSAEYPYGVNELEIVGLETLPSLKVKPPRIKRSPVHFECRLEKAIEIGNAEPGSATLVVGRILEIHIAENIIESNRIDIERLDPISRLGGNSYGKVKHWVDLPRPRKEIE